MCAEGTIEDVDPSGRGWQCDFANAYIGGGVPLPVIVVLLLDARAYIRLCCYQVLGRGCVQEEIRFTISPTAMVCPALTLRVVLSAYETAMQCPVLT
eukprot:2977712-Rhodomonas_salina.3